MNTENTTIIEINGVKMEVDMRYAKRVDTFRIGTKVKLLCKNDYNGIRVLPGVIVGFEPFESLPTIIVAYVEQTYNEASVKMAYINTDKKSVEKWEIVPALDEDLPIAKGSVLKLMDREIEKKRLEIEDLERRRAYFIESFGAYFTAADEALA